MLFVDASSDMLVESWFNSVSLLASRVWRTERAPVKNTIFFGDSSYSFILEDAFNKATTSALC